MKERYIDRKFAAKKFLQDWHTFETKLQDSKEKLTEINARMFSVSSPIGSTPVQGGGSKREENLCRAIDRKTVEENRFSQASEYFKDALPAWEGLTSEQQWVLRTRYIEYDEFDEQRPLEKIMQKFHVERRKAFELQNEALEKFAFLLF